MHRTILAATALLWLASAGVALADPHSHHDWRKGSHIAAGDWGRGQHIDYRAHHLRAPPRGYEWRQVDGNYVLAAVAGGLIASVILAH
jgi:Ni/Co efflux regulator RcnB